VPLRCYAITCGFGKFLGSNPSGDNGAITGDGSLVVSTALSFSSRISNPVACARRSKRLGSLLESHVMRMVIAPPNREPSRAFYTDRSRERPLRNAIVARSDALGDPVVVPKDRSATKFRRWKQTTICRPSNFHPKEGVLLHWDRHSWQSSSSKPEGYLKSRGPYT
jgi:hypothetical protein